MSANFGPSGLVNSTDAFANKRFKAFPNYFYVRGDSSYNTKLPAGLRLTLRLAGQFAVEPLISNENFSIGGSDGVRGYLEAQQLGDLGVKGSVQVGSPILHWGAASLGDAFVFFDEGRVGFLNSLPGEPGHAALRSWGVGFDLLPGRGFTASFVWADPLLNDGATLAGESRWLFLVRSSF
jgi:hemolysin activation/secretion protein